MAAGRARGSRPRRVSLPGVAALLRPVGPGPASDSGRQASGREAHPQKITVYLSADELLDLERARLTLLAHGDRKSTRLNSSHVTTSRMPSSA